jgi:Condensation domain
MESVILVPFEGEGRGTADPTWGQLEIWTALSKQNFSMTLNGAMALPPGSTLEHVIATMRYIMSRHQSLRTRLSFDPDAVGGIRQVLYERGEVPLRIMDVEEGEDPQQVAADLLQRLSAAKFDYADEWPVRMALVRRDGIATHSVAVYCHLALDSYGLQALVEDLADLDFSVAGIPPSKAVQPMQLARSQAEPDGVRQHEATVRRWRRQLAKVPARRFGDPSDERVPRQWHARLESPAIHLATPLLCARLRADPTAVALAAVAVELARVTGQSPSVVQIVAHNRFRPGLADAVTPVAQTGLCVVEVADTTFDEIVARAWRSCIQAYMNSYYNPILLDEMVAGLGRERGEEIDLGCYFNDRRAQDIRPAHDPPPDPEQLARALDRGTLTWGEPTPDPGERFFITLEEHPDSTLILMDADTRYLPPGHIEGLLRGMERTLVAAALDPGARTGVRLRPGQAAQVSAA